MRWRQRLPVAVATLDALIERHGLPAFAKIDVEGQETAVLQGLSQPLAALSVEYVTAALPATLAALDRLQAIGSYGFNRSEGESLRLLHDRWRTAAEMAAELECLGVDAGSGDLYARVQTAG